VTRKDYPRHKLQASPRNSLLEFITLPSFLAAELEMFTAAKKRFALQPQAGVPYTFAALIQTFACFTHNLFVILKN